SGSFTIPMMKKAGFKPEFAAATEAAASTGGQIMPPLMGAAAFIMMEYLGVPYSTIMLAAIIPAILYFAGILSVPILKRRKWALLESLKNDYQNLRSSWYKTDICSFLFSSLSVRF